MDLRGQWWLFRARITGARPASQACALGSRPRPHGVDPVLIAVFEMHNDLSPGHSAFPFLIVSLRSRSWSCTGGIPFCSRNCGVVEDTGKGV